MLLKDTIKRETRAFYLHSDFFINQSRYFLNTAKYNNHTDSPKRQVTMENKSRYYLSYWSKLFQSTSTTTQLLLQDLSVNVFVVFQLILNLLRWNYTFLREVLFSDLWLWSFEDNMVRQPGAYLHLINKNLV